MSFPAILAEILKGFHITVVVTAIGLLYAIPFALFFGIFQHFSRGALRALVTSVIEFWRSSSVVVLMYGFYYTLPAFGVQLSAITVGAMVVGLNVGGYGSQSVRAALQAMDRGQSEAGLALGMNRFDVLRFVELPQALTAMIPTFINQVIQLVKGTTVVSLITLADMTFRAKELSQSQYDPVGIYTALLLVYFVLCYPVTIIGRRIEVAYAKGARRIDEL